MCAPPEPRIESNSPEPEEGEDQEGGDSQGDMGPEGWGDIRLFNKNGKSVTIGLYCTWFTRIISAFQSSEEHDNCMSLYALFQMTLCATSSAPTGPASPTPTAATGNKTAWEALTR